MFAVVTYGLCLRYYALGGPRLIAGILLGDDARLTSDVYLTSGVCRVYRA